MRGDAGAEGERKWGNNGGRSVGGNGKENGGKDCNGREGLKLEAFCSLVLFGRREGGAGFGRKGSGLYREDGRGAEVEGVCVAEKIKFKPGGAATLVFEGDMFRFRVLLCFSQMFKITPSFVCVEGYYL